MNEVVITISIRLPDGVTPDVSYGTAPAATVPRTRPVRLSAVGTGRVRTKEV